MLTATILGNLKHDGPRRNSGAWHEHGKEKDSKEILDHEANTQSERAEAEGKDKVKSERGKISVKEITFQ